MKVHPNTQAVLDAWRRLADGRDPADSTTEHDDPALVASLFVINHVGERDYAFRRAGHALERLFGRQLADHNFLSLWNDGDRGLVAAGLAVALRDRGPIVVRARGETLAGKQMDLEFALAPLIRSATVLHRFLGLCQTMAPEEILNGRPLRRLQALAVFPPAPQQSPTIRIISSN